MSERPTGSRDTEERRHVWDDPANVRRLFRVFYACCAVLVGLGFFVHRHAQHPWEHLIEFYPVYGFVGITVLVLLARVLRRLVMRPENYYDGD